MSKLLKLTTKIRRTSAAKIGATWLSPVILVFVGNLALIASAKIQVPFFPVPLTLQTMLVVMIGATFGVRMGLAAIIVYLFEGLIGLPVFAGTPLNGLGLAYILGPTGGYLLGFVFAAALSGYLINKFNLKSLFGLFALFVLGHAVIYLFGFSYLSSLIGFENAVKFGVIPFILGDIAKSAIGALILRSFIK